VARQIVSSLSSYVADWLKAYSQVTLKTSLACYECTAKDGASYYTWKNDTDKFVKSSESGEPAVEVSHITLDNPIQVTVPSPHGLHVGDAIKFDGIGGTVELNHGKQCLCVRRSV
jgi:hypothetical protein